MSGTTGAATGLTTSGSGEPGARSKVDSPVMTLTPIRTGFASVLAVVLAACSPASPPPAGPADGTPLTAPLTGLDTGPVVARVQGIAITQEWLAALARARRVDLSDPEQHSRVLDELIGYAALIDSARQGGQALSSDVRAEIELNALVLRANAIAANLATELDEAELRAEYDKQIHINGDHEYQLAHLLFDDESAALEAAQAITAGGSFDQVMATFKDRAKQAVDLGWVKLGQLPPEFAAAVTGLSDGQSTAQPVKTNYGFHVVQRKTSRPLTVPEYDQVREGIRRMLVARHTEAAMEALREKARIEIVGQ